MAANNTPVSKLSFGGAGIGSYNEKIFFNAPVPDNQAVDAVICALENGINLIDTSPFYGNSEMKIGLAIREYGKRNSYIVSTKAGTHPSLGGYTSGDFYKSIENSLKKLKTDYIDIVHIHDPSDADFETVMNKNGGIKALQSLKEDKIIRYIGLGVRSHHLHRKFIDSGFADVILPYLDYNVLNTSAAQLISYAAEKDVSVMLGSPMCMGLLSGADPLQYKIGHFPLEKEVSVEKATEMFQWCRKNKLNLSSLNFKFIRENSDITTVLTGALSKDEVTENVKLFSEKINKEIFNDFLSEFELW